MTSSELRKIAEDLRDQANKIKVEKTVKCAKYIVGMTALVMLKNKMRGK